MQSVVPGLITRKHIGEHIPSVFKQIEVLENVAGENSIDARIG
jgi:hypothetical protein